MFACMHVMVNLVHNLGAKKVHKLGAGSGRAASYSSSKVRLLSKETLLRRLTKIASGGNFLTEAEIPYGGWSPDVLMILFFYHTVSILLEV